jgi:hypothetical protein
MDLIKPDWKNMVSDKACAAVRKLTDQTELTRAARETPDFYARLIAVEALTSQDVLTDIAQNDKTGYIRMVAADMLTDRGIAERVYADIALDDGGGVRVSSSTFRIEAVERISNQALLAELSKQICPAYYAVQRVVVEKLTNQDALTEIAQESKFWWGNRIAAADKLENQTLAQKIYADIARNDTNYDARSKAVGRLTDQGLLITFVRTTGDIELRIKAADKLTDRIIAENIYLNIAKNYVDNDTYRNTVVPKIIHQYLLSDCERNGHEWGKTGECVGCGEGKKPCDGVAPFMPK